MMTPAQAKSKLLGLLNDTCSAIKPQLRTRDDWPSVAWNDAPKDTANASLNRYVMTKIAHAKLGALLGIVERHWKARGYTIESVNADAQMPAIFARAPDGSSVGLEVGRPGNVTLIADVNPIAAPDPLATADIFGPRPPQPTTSSGDPDIMPKYDDPFWSH